MTEIIDKQKEKWGQSTIGTVLSIANDTFGFLSHITVLEKSSKMP